MSVNNSDQDLVRRYRRRILLLGATLLTIVFVVGAAIFIPWVQRDLADRSVEELEKVGIGGVTVSFSGQDGTVTCAEPLDDPAGVETMLEDLWGVRTIDIESSCRASAVIESSEPETTEPPATDPPATQPPATDPPTTDAPAAEPAVTESITDLLGADPQYSTLLGALEATGLDVALAGDGPFTIFAPTNDAFGAVDPALLGGITSDPELLTAVLQQHVTSGAVASTDLTTGNVQMLSGDSVAVDVSDGVSLTSLDATGGETVATVTEPDIPASNGIIHSIDTVLLPPTVDPAIVRPGRDVSASFGPSGFRLSGTVASNDERVALINAAVAAFPNGDVIDEIAIDPNLVGNSDAEATAATNIAGLAGLIEAMPVNMATGDATLVGNSLSLSGTYLSDEANTTLTDLATAAGADADLSPRPEADAATAADLEEQLNSYVAANPVTFEPSSFQLTAEAELVLDQVAVFARQLAGVNINVEGHTDSDGAAQTNLTLSNNRAAAVVDALVTRGLDPATLTSEGFGSTVPILVDGVEDKAASRRVEFDVDATAN